MGKDKQRRVDHEKNKYRDGEIGKNDEKEKTKEEIDKWLT